MFCQRKLNEIRISQVIQAFQKDIPQNEPLGAHVLTNPWATQSPTVSAAVTEYVCIPSCTKSLMKSIFAMPDLY